MPIPSPAYLRTYLRSNMSHMAAVSLTYKHTYTGQIATVYRYIHYNNAPANKCYYYYTLRGQQVSALIADNTE